MGSSVALLADVTAGAGAEDMRGASGDDSISSDVGRNERTLSTYTVPPGQYGVFFCGAKAKRIPFGDSYRCSAQPLQRLRSVQIASDLVATYRVEFTAPPSPIDRFTPRSTWNFQFIDNDPNGPGSGALDLTTTLRVSFHP